MVHFIILYYIKNDTFSYVAAENVLCGNNIKRALYGGFDLHKIRTLKHNLW